ncbi:MAG: hypothetical protein AB7P76_06370 [Candidatus Melainabacteria bacterium]
MLLIDAGTFRARPGRGGFWMILQESEARRRIVYGHTAATAELCDHDFRRLQTYINLLD